MELVPPKMAPPKPVVTPKALAAATAAGAAAPPGSGACAPAAEAVAPAIVCAVFEDTAGSRGDEEDGAEGSHPGLGSAAAAVQYTR